MKMYGVFRELQLSRKKQHFINCEPVPIWYNGVKIKNNGETHEVLIARRSLSVVISIGLRTFIAGLSPTVQRQREG